MARVTQNTTNKMSNIHYVFRWFCGFAMFLTYFNTAHNDMVLKMLLTKTMLHVNCIT